MTASENDWLRHPSTTVAWLATQTVLLAVFLAVLGAATYFMGMFLIAEAAITLAAFPLAIAIVGTLFLGGVVALAWALTIFIAFASYFGMAPHWAVAYAVLYGAGAWLVSWAIRRYHFDNLRDNPVRSLIGWYLIVGIAAPTVTSLIGVPLLYGGGAAEPDASFFLLFVSNFMSDSFSPLSLGFALFAAGTLVTGAHRSLQPSGLKISELAIWSALLIGASTAVVGFGTSWTFNGIHDAAPIFYLLLAWSALRFNLVLTMAATAAVGLLITCCVTFGWGGTPVPASTLDVLSVYANLLALTVLAQTIAAMSQQSMIENARAIAAELDRAQLKRYFSPRIVDELLSHKDSASRTRRQRVVVMFVDIIGFTRIAERQTPEETIAMLREFDTAMEDQIFSHKGVVDKYIGDGVMAAFGLPDVGDADVMDAIRCAVSMIDRAARLADERRRAGKTPYEISIGLHYGDVVAGNVGSERNLSFTVIGDTVNTASRLEAITRELGASIAVSGTIFDEANREGGPEATDFLERFRFAGEHLLKGRQTPIPVWIMPRAAPGAGAQ